MGKVLEMLPRLKRENTFHLRLDLTLDYIVLAAAHMSRFTLPPEKKNFSNSFENLGETKMGNKRGGVRV